MSLKLPDRFPRSPWIILGYIAQLTASSFLGGSLLKKLPVEYFKQHFFIPFLVAMPLYFVAREVGKLLMGDWIKDIASKIDNVVRTVLGGYHRKYLEHVISECRNFDMKALSTIGTFALRLQHVFVQPLVSPAPKLPPGSIIPLDIVEPLAGSDIWPYLQPESNSTPDNLVIIGRPGGGKTTLLRHIALVLAQPKQRKKHQAPRKLPILLALRHHVSDIKDNPDLPFIEAIKQSKLYREMSEPVPLSWFESQLNKGKCIVLFDGLDEVADPEMYASVESWLEQQMRTYYKNQFIITSRPRVSAQRIADVHRLIIHPFRQQQISQFVENWCIANAVAEARRDTVVIRAEATKDARDLLERVSASRELNQLAVNPLLLTMMATIHRFRGKLPERQIELYREIWEVFLSRRDYSPMPSGLATSQKRCVLEPLAYAMMTGRTQEMEAAQTCEIISDTLERVSPGTDPAAFLKDIEEGSGLLLKKENGKYGFAHKTLQEYLTAVFCTKKTENLAQRVGDEWWHGVIRLYVAQADGTAICAACLEKLKNATVASGIYELAKACLNEAQELDLKMREALENVLAALPTPPRPAPVEIQPVSIVPQREFAHMFRWASGVAAIVVVVTVGLWAWYKAPSPHPKINAVFLLSGDMQTMADMQSACYNALVKYSDVIGDVSYLRVGPLGKGPDSEKEWKIAMDGLEEKLASFSSQDTNYIIAIGTPASMRAKARFGPMLSRYRLIGIGLTDPFAAGLITQATDRNDPLPIGVVAFVRHPEDWVRLAQKVVPDHTLHYVYETGFAQNEYLASPLRKMKLTPPLLITGVDHPLSDDDFPDPDEVYFSWYPFEQADVHPKVLQNRIFVATRREDVEPDGLAAFGISPNRKELGQQGADLLIKDFRGEQPLGRTDMGFPTRLYYWVNCRNANRRHLSFSEEIIEHADERFGCDATRRAGMNSVSVR
jgi:energy-coupling factor transporter ATP-binding protein EcfA2